jgi:excisionase family DNA binding protein
MNKKKVPKIVFHVGDKVILHGIWEGAGAGVIVEQDQSATPWRVKLDKPFMGYESVSVGDSMIEPVPVEVLRTPLPHDIYTIEEAAEYFRCGRSMMFDLIKEWNMKTFLVGRQRRITIWEMQRVARERENSAA